MSMVLIEVMARERTASLHRGAKLLSPDARGFHPFAAARRSLPGAEALGFFEAGV